MLNKSIILSLVIIFTIIVIRIIITDRVAGGIVYKIEKDESISYLLITATGNRWIFPKGKVRFYEFSKQGAIREVNEESGIKAKIMFRLESNPFFYQKKSGKEQSIELFAMEYIAEMDHWQEKQRRERKWISYSEAISVLNPEFGRALDEVNSNLLIKVGN